MKIVYFISTLACWSTFIIINSIMDSIVFHPTRKWYQNLILWHRLKYPCIGAAVATGYLANEFFQLVNYDWAYGLFFIGYAILWRRGLFERLIDTWAGRIKEEK